MTAEEWATCSRTPSARDEDRKRIAAEMEAFLRSGKKITRIERGISADPDARKVTGIAKADTAREKAKGSACRKRDRFTAQQKQLLDAITSAVSMGIAPNRKSLQAATGWRIDAVDSRLDTLQKNGYIKITDDGIEIARAGK